MSDNIITIKSGQSIVVIQQKVVNGQIVTESISTVRNSGQPEPPKPEPPKGPVLFRNDTGFKYAEAPGVCDRLQSPKRIKLAGDTWLHTTDTRFEGESPEDMFQRGHSLLFWTSLTDAERAALTADSPVRFQFETGGDSFPGVRDPISCTLSDLQWFADQFWDSLPRFNTEPANGLPLGAKEGFVKLINFNIESGDWNEDAWKRVTGPQKRTKFYNYKTEQRETLQDCYDRGKLAALEEARQAKLHNIHVLALLMQKHHAPGAKVTHGDLRILNHPEISIDIDYDYDDQHHTIEPNELAKDPFGAEKYGWFWQNLFSEANAGSIKTHGVTFDVSGKVFAHMDVFFDYNYEGFSYIKKKDYEEFKATNDPDKTNVAYWENVAWPVPETPYKVALGHDIHNAVLSAMGWQDKGYIAYQQWKYEFDLVLADMSNPDGSQIRVDSSYEWLKRAMPKGLSPEKQFEYEQKMFVARSRVRGRYLGAWMRGTGYKSWNEYKFLGKNGPARYTQTHLLPPQEIQKLIDELNSYGVPQSGPDCENLCNRIPIWNSNTNEYIMGDAQVLFRQKKVDNKWDYHFAVPLVEGKKQISTGKAVYRLYDPRLMPGEICYVKWKAWDGTLLEWKLTYTDNDIMVCYDPKGQKTVNI